MNPGNAERELQADAKSDNKEVKRISYAGLIARKHFIKQLNLDKFVQIFVRLQV